MVSILNRSLVSFILLSLIALCGTAMADSDQDSKAPATTTLPAYTVQPGDLLMISVWKEEGLQGEVLVRPDGGISFPLVGDIQASGNSIDQLNTLIAERLSKYIPDPVVNVAVRSLAGNKVYVIGKVIRSGEFPLTSYVDVMQAISMAGGTNPFAALNDIKILRREAGKQRAIPFRYADVEAGKKLEQNIILRSGDIVVVP